MTNINNNSVIDNCNENDAHNNNGENLSITEGRRDC